MIDGARQRVAILGCTGSIGLQALDVCRKHPDRLEVVALSAHRQTDVLVKAAREFSCPFVAVTDEAHRHDPVLDELPASTRILFGTGALTELAELPEVDTVLVAVVGAVRRVAGTGSNGTETRLYSEDRETLYALREDCLHVDHGRTTP